MIDEILIHCWTSLELRFPESKSRTIGTKITFIRSLEQFEEISKLPLDNYFVFSQVT